jgi:23S rRNA pseudouridine2605 synthase
LVQEAADLIVHRRIAASGLWSRRKAQALIVEGRVEVDGHIVIDKAARCSADAIIRVNGKRIEAARIRYLALNKPTGYVTTLADPYAKRTVAELIAQTGAMVKPVGRLDKDTEGLLLLTNDGDLAFRLTHPKFGIEKEYEVTVRGVIPEIALAKLEAGVYIEGGKTAPAEAPREKVHVKEGKTTFHLVVHEGRKHQVRLMCFAVGFPVQRLRRVRIGPVGLRGLPKGACRDLSAQEIKALKSAAGLQSPSDDPSAGSAQPRPKAPSKRSVRRHRTVRQSEK